MASLVTTTVDGTLTVEAGVGGVAQTLSATSTNSLVLKNTGHATNGGLVLQGSGGGFGIQLYWSTTTYGFLDGAWASWDIKKVLNGAFSVDEGSGLKRVLTEAGGTFNGQVTINQDANNYALYIDSESASYESISVRAKWGMYIVQDIGGGYGMYITRNLNEAGAYALVSVNSDHTASTQPALWVNQDGAGYGIRLTQGGANTALNIVQGGAAAGIAIDQNGNGTAIYINSESTTANTIESYGKYGLYHACDISGGYGLYIARNLNEAGTSNLATFIDDHTANTQTTVYIRHDGSSGYALDCVGAGRFSGAVTTAALTATTGSFAGHVTPATNISYNLGSSSLRWLNIYGNVADFSGNLSCGGLTASTGTFTGAIAGIAANFTKTTSDAYTPTAYNNDPILTLLSPNANTQYSGIRFSNAAGTYEKFIGSVQVGSGSDLVFQGYDNAATAYKEYARVQGGGNVGIGTNAPAYKLDVNGAARIVDGISSPAFWFRPNAFSVHCWQPKGGWFHNQVNAHTGAIRIKLPPMHDAMVTFWVDVYDYADNESFSAYISGYPYQGTTWSWTSAVIIGGAERNLTVRFGDNNTAGSSAEYYVYIGETGSTWNHIQVVVRDVFCGYHVYANEWDGGDDGWGVSFATSFENVAKTQSNTLPYGDYNKLLNTPTLSFLPLSGGTLTGALNGTTATFTGNITTNSTTHAYVVINSSATTTASWVYHKQGGNNRWLAGVEGSETRYQLYSNVTGSTGVKFALDTIGNGTFSGGLTATTGSFAGHVTPATNISYNLGSSSLRWLTVYGNTANFSGDVTINSLLIASGSSDTIYANRAVFGLRGNTSVNLMPGGTTRLLCNSSGITVTGAGTFSGALTLNNAYLYTPANSYWRLGTTWNTGSMTWLNGVSVMGEMKALHLSWTAFRVGTGSTPSTGGYYLGNSYTGMYSITANTVGWIINNAEKMRLTYTGLGIGTTSPVQKLDVSGNISIYSRNTGTSGEIDKLIFQKQHTNGVSGPYVLGEIRSFTANGYSGGLNFYTGRHAGGGSYASTFAMQINESGNVGIGTTSPSKLLTVNPSTAGDGIYLLESDSVNPCMLWQAYSNYGIFTMYERGDVQNVISTKLDGGGGGVIFNEKGYAFDFRIEGDTDQNLFFLDGSTDRIGIGDSTPSYKLDVNGTFRVTGASVFGNISSTLNPSADSTYSLGGNTTRWAVVFADTLYGAGSNITSLNANNISSGTVAVARLGLTSIASTITPSLDSTYSLGGNTTRWASVFADTLYGAGSNITSLNASALSSGTVPTARLGTGTASSSTFLRGDNTWVANASGTVTSVTAGTGMTQSGTSTINPTLNVIGGLGITANANDIALNLNELVDSNKIAAGDKVAFVDINASSQSAICEVSDIPLSVFDNDSGWTSNPAVSIASSAADVLGASNGAISADDAGTDKLVFWDDSAGKLKYLTFSALTALP